MNMMMFRKKTRWFLFEAARTFATFRQSDHGPTYSYDKLWALSAQQVANPITLEWFNGSLMGLMGFNEI